MQTFETRKVQPYVSCTDSMLRNQVKYNLPSTAYMCRNYVHELLLTCKWTVHVGQATSLIRLPDPSDFEPENEHANEGVRGKFV